MLRISKSPKPQKKIIPGLPDKHGHGSSDRSQSRGFETDRTGWWHRKKKGWNVFFQILGGVQGHVAKRCQRCGIETSPIFSET